MRDVGGLMIGSAKHPVIFHGWFEKVAWAIDDLQRECARLSVQ